jgi:STE24 endopeptidase
MQRRLALHSLADPEPPRWAHWWFGSHPTVLERIAIAETMRDQH